MSGKPPVRKPRAAARRSITKSAKNAAFKRRNIVRCNYCGKGLTRTQATGDHKQPVSKGGANKQKNVVVACLDCNQRKGSMPMGTFMQIIRADGTYMSKRKGHTG
ncbi:MAG: HNH endonuclease [Pseudomonadota bacterium]